LLRSYHLLRAVASRHEVDLFAFVQEPWLRALFPSRDEGLEECRRALSSICRSVNFVPIERHQRLAGRMRTAFEAMFEQEGYIEGWLRSANASAALTAMSARSHYDLVHFDTIALARYRGLFRAVPATLGHHNIESDTLLRRADNQRNPFLRWYFRRESRRLRRFEQRIAATFAKHIVCSPSDAQRLLAITPHARIAVVPNGVDCEYFHPRGSAQRPDSLIFVGTMNWYPNTDAVLLLLRKIWPKVRSAKPRATLELVGANPPRNVRSLAARSPGVTLRGFLPDIRPLLETASLVVCPVRDGGGTKLKILDACAMTKCVVAHPIACDGIDLESGKDVVLAGTPEETVFAILRLLDDAPTRQRIGTAARLRMLQQYSFASIGAELAALFAQMASEPR
jgi:glycosyltransferase involved in cell wall biosynthesis